MFLFEKYSNFDVFSCQQWLFSLKLGTMLTGGTDLHCFHTFQPQGSFVKYFT